MTRTKRASAGGGSKHEPKVSQMEQSEGNNDSSNQVTSPRTISVMAAAAMAAAARAAATPAATPAAPGQQQQQQVISGGRLIQKKRTANFREDETKLLIQLWGSPQVQNKLFLNHRKAPVMRMLATNMQQRGFFRTPDEIKTRIRNLKCLYHRIKRTVMSGTGLGTVDPDWPHFKAMDAILNRRGGRQQMTKAAQEIVAMTMNGNRALFEELDSITMEPDTLATLNFGGPKCDEIKQEPEFDVEDNDSWATNDRTDSEYDDDGNATTPPPPLHPAPSAASAAAAVAAVAAAATPSNTGTNMPRITVATNLKDPVSIKPKTSATNAQSTLNTPTQSIPPLMQLQHQQQKLQQQQKHVAATTTVIPNFAVPSSTNSQISQSNTIRASNRLLIVQPQQIADGLKSGNFHFVNSACAAVTSAAATPPISPPQQFSTLPNAAMAAAAAMATTNSHEVAGLLRDILDVQRDSLQVQREKLEVEKQRLQYDRIVGTQLITLLPMMGNIINRLSSRDQPQHNGGKNISGSTTTSDENVHGSGTYPERSDSVMEMTVIPSDDDDDDDGLDIDEDDDFVDQQQATTTTSVSSTASASNQKAAKRGIKRALMTDNDDDDDGSGDSNSDVLKDSKILKSMLEEGIKKYMMVDHPDEERLRKEAETEKKNGNGAGVTTVESSSSENEDDSGIHNDVHSDVGSVHADDNVEVVVAEGAALTQSC